MSETRALTIRQQLTPDRWQMFLSIADNAHKSRALKVTSVQDAALRIEAGDEIGLPPIAAIRSIYIVNGQPSIRPKSAWALIMGHPEFDPSGFREEELSTPEGEFFGWRITLKRRNGLVFTRQFTLDDAKQAGLLTKDNWTNYPKHTCYWRALGAVEDVAFPDVLMGLYRADELGASITPDGDIVEGSWSEAAPAPAAPASVAPAVVATPTVTLDDLLAKYSPDQIMEANDGRIPGTDEEVAAVAARLAASNE